MSMSRKILRVFSGFFYFTSLYTHASVWLVGSILVHILVIWHFIYRINQTVAKNIFWLENGRCSKMQLFWVQKGVLLRLSQKTPFFGEELKVGSWKSNFGFLGVKKIQLMMNYLLVKKSVIPARFKWLKEMSKHGTFSHFCEIGPKKAKNWRTWILGVPKSRKQKVRASFML